MNEFCIEWIKGNDSSWRAVQEDVGRKKRNGGIANERMRVLREDF